jgi:aspartate carbamoyltransferase regulatory subunit
VKELKVTPIKNGTVIDHITVGMALQVVRILGIADRGASSTVSVLMHVPSADQGWKDIVKVEDRELEPREVDKISLIAPKATINIIRNFNVEEKHRVALPDEVVGILRCENHNCISNSAEPIDSRFRVVRRDPLLLRCGYCEREVSNVLANMK